MHPVLRATTTKAAAAPASELAQKTTRKTTRQTPRIQAPAFTLIELLVVIAIIALLLGILLPTLSNAYQRAREVADAAKLRQLAAATQMYLDDNDLALPQYLVQGNEGEPTPIGALFGGKKGKLPFFEIDRVGAARRPLNQYILDTTPPPDIKPDGTPSDPLDIPAFESPIDAGGENLVPIPGLEQTDSMYDFLGSSYTLNDHAPDTNPAADDFPTLIPPRGGPVPPLLDPSKTWVLATHSIYNYDDAGSATSNRGHNWFADKNQTKANLAFADAHVQTARPVPPNQAHTTDDYTFLPRPDWITNPTF